MPFISVKMATGQSLEAKRKLVAAVTKATCESLDIKPEWVTILIEELDRENWANAGALYSDKLSGNDKGGA
jgi:4-oxalocrotonate tautomerase